VFNSVKWGDKEEIYSLDWSRSMVHKELPEIGEGLGRQIYSGR
jgi:hypothetical protein